MAQWRITMTPTNNFGVIQAVPDTKTITADDADIEDGNLYLYDAAGQVVYTAARGMFIDCELIADPASLQLTLSEDSVLRCSHGHDLTGVDHRMGGQRYTHWDGTVCYHPGDPIVTTVTAAGAVLGNAG